MAVRNSPVLTDGDDRFTRLNMRYRPLQLKAGEVAVSENGRMDTDLGWQCREGYKNVSGVTLSTTLVPRLYAATPTTDARLFLIGVNGVADSAELVSTVCTVTTSAAHGLPTGTSLVNLVHFNALGAGPDIDGNRSVTRTGASTFTFTIAGTDDTYLGGTTGPFKLSGDTVEIHGSCIFSDPDDSNLDYIIIADNAQATALKLSDLSKTTIAYPSLTLDQDCDLIQEFDKVALRQKGKTSWFLEGVSAVTSGGFTVGNSYVIVTVGTTDYVSEHSASANTIGVQFTAVVVGTGTGTAQPAFTKFGTGAATQHSIYDTAGNSVSVSGVVTVTETAHGRSVGDKLLVVSAAGYETYEGMEIQIATVPGANSFTFYADVPDDAGTSVVYSTKASLGGGFVNPPGAAWGIYHQQRSWVPYNYDSTSTPVHRGIEDELIASDIFSHVYDPIFNQFRTSAGSADFLVGLHGFDDDRLIVFNRNSIHYLRGVSGGLDDVQNIELTKDIGCVARKSIISYANSIYFWSDGGAYAVQFQDELNLRGAELPLSEAVDPIVKRITPGAAEKIIGIYHDNRLWWALPLDGYTSNSHILVFNLLNGGWESLDFTALSGTSGWEIVGLHEARSGKINELYAVTTTGGVHRLTGGGLDMDSVVANSGVTNNLTIASTLHTRAYPFGSLRRKKFQRLRAHLKSHASYKSQGDISVITEDPDETLLIGQIRGEFTGGLTKGEDGTFHKRIGNPRGIAAQFKFTKESGLPSIRAIQIDAVPAFESTTSVS